MSAKRDDILADLPFVPTTNPKYIYEPRTTLPELKVPVRLMRAAEVARRSGLSLSVIEDARGHLFWAAREVCRPNFAIDLELIDAAIDADALVRFEREHYDGGNRLEGR